MDCRRAYINHLPFFWGEVYAIATMNHTVLLSCARVNWYSATLLLSATWRCVVVHCKGSGWTTTWYALIWGTVKLLSWFRWASANWGEELMPVQSNPISLFHLRCLQLHLCSVEVLLQIAGNLHNVACRLQTSYVFIRWQQRFFWSSVVYMVVDKVFVWTTSSSGAKMVVVKLCAFQSLLEHLSLSWTRCSSETFLLYLSKRPYT